MHSTCVGNGGPLAAADEPSHRKQVLKMPETGERTKVLHQERCGIELPPIASMLMQSLRSVGYSTASALADLVDNSIAARAASVRIAVTMTSSPFVAVSDDGFGMDEATLLAAMRFGSRDPRERREKSDLG